MSHQYWLTKARLKRIEPFSRVAPNSRRLDYVEREKGAVQPVSMPPDFVPPRDVARAPNSWTPTSRRCSPLALRRMRQWLRLAARRRALYRLRGISWGISPARALSPTPCVAGDPLCHGRWNKLILGAG